MKRRNAFEIAGRRGCVEHSGLFRGFGRGRAETMTRSVGYVADTGFRLPDFQLEAPLGSKNKKCRAESKQRYVQDFTLFVPDIVTQ